MSLGIMSFCSMLLHYNIDEKKKSIPVQGYYLEFACSTHVCVCFLHVFLFPLTSQKCAHELNWSVKLS